MNKCAACGERVWFFQNYYWVKNPCGFSVFHTNCLLSYLAAWVYEEISPARCRVGAKRR